MLDRIIRFSIANKVLVMLAAVALVVWGLWSLTHLPIDAVPDITNNQVQIITRSPSLATQEVERFITYPIEVATATVPGLIESRSLSRFGLSVVTLVFSDDTDVYWARQQIAERLQLVAGEIPAGYGTPELAPVSTGLGEIYQYTLQPKPGWETRYSLQKLREVQDYVVRRRLLGIPGVADISSFGGHLKQYEIAVDPEVLRSHGLTIADVCEAVAKSNANTGGAYIEKGASVQYVRVEGLARSLADLESIAVGSDAAGSPVLVRDVGVVRPGSAVRYGAMTLDDKGEVVGGIVMMLKGANSSAVVDAVVLRIEEINGALPEGLSIVPFLDRTKLVDRTIKTVATNLTEGALIVIFVLVLMLGNLRAGLIVASVIPLSMLFAIGCMRYFGVSGNLMSLGAIDFGIVVDGAVIVVEATLHHLALLPAGAIRTQQEMDREVYSSAVKIRSAAAFGEIIILIVYLPILALTGIEGKMFGPMAQTVAFAIAGAFILSLTYVPMMSALVLKQPKEHAPTISDRFVALLQRLYTPTLELALRLRWPVVISSVAAFAASLLLFARLGGEFIPQLDEGDFALEIRLGVGSSIDQSVHVSLLAGKILQDQFPEVAQVVGKIGTSEIPTDPMPMEAGDIMVVLKPREEWVTANTREELADTMARALAAIPGVAFSFQQPIQMRFNELMTGARQDVVMKIYGDDMDSLAAAADRMAAAIESVPGVQDLFVEKVGGLPEVVVTPNRERLARYGLRVEDVNTTVNAAFAGAVEGTFFEGEQRFDIAVRVPEQFRGDQQKIATLAVRGSRGQMVALAEVADIAVRMGPSQIQRDAGRRRITVAFNVRGRDVESTVTEIKQVLDRSFALPTGYFFSIGGAFKNLEEASARLAVALPIALALIFALLFFTFRSLTYCLLIFSAIPLAGVGGVVALWLRSLPFSISAGVGFIALFGVAVLNGIVLLSSFLALRKEFPEMSIRQVVLEGTRSRLRPVVMTAMVASFGFLPMALSHSAGAEVQRPLATVVIGGLITATLLTLILLPVLFFLVESRRGRPRNIAAAAVALAALVLGAPAAGAQPAPISRAEALARARGNSPELAAERARLQAAREMMGTSWDIGRTSVEIQYGQNNTVANDANISVVQTIPFPTVFAARAAANTAALESQTAGLAVAESDLYLLVMGAAAERWRASGIAALTRSFDSLVAVAEAVTDRHVQEGSAPPSQLAYIRMERSAARIALAAAERDSAQAAYRLGVLLGSEPDSVPEVADAIPSIVPPRLDTATQSPEVSAARALAGVAEAERDKLRAEGWPSLLVGYFNQSLIGWQQAADGSERWFGASERFDGIRLGIEVPLWFGPESARRSASTFQAEAARHDAAAAVRMATLHYRQALADYDVAEASLRSLRSALAEGDAVRSSGVRQLEEGSISLFDFVRTLQTLNQLRQAEVAALFSRADALFRIERILGTQR